jgi:hypothetical protein
MRVQLWRYFPAMLEHENDLGAGSPDKRTSSVAGARFA